jgi:2-polyprenyl-6-methoxyphenol hydroxylase-like FAD-dependent oxidoreductase
MVAGLATARALDRQGIECDVVERAHGWTHPGAGMYLPANSVRALDRLGRQLPVHERAQKITRQRFLDDRGRLLLDAELARVWGPTGQCLALGRRELHEVLRDGIAVRLAMQVDTLREDGTRVHTVFSDGSSAV